jgi:hypothetical protein
MDPLKLAYGVKHPLSDKNLQGLIEQGKRYYPTDGRGHLNEWAAVIKH